MTSGHVAAPADSLPAGATVTLPLGSSFNWLRTGWQDFTTQPQLSLFYGLGVFIVSLIAVALIFVGGWSNVLFPALAAFMIVGPVVAVGLYEKSRLLETGEEVKLRNMVRVGFRSGQQIFFIGVMLTLLVVLWMRAAKITYALFFGWRAIPDDFASVVEVLFFTPMGLAMLFTGSVIGALFAGLAFGISAVSIPMVLDRNIDAMTAMGTSMRLVWRNLGAMFVWGAIVLGAFLVSLATGLIGLIIIFPLIGHATWHAYRAVREPAGALSGGERRI